MKCKILQSSVTHRNHYFMQYHANSKKNLFSYTEVPVFVIIALEASNTIVTTPWVQLSGTDFRCIWRSVFKDQFYECGWVEKWGSASTWNSNSYIQWQAKHFFKIYSVDENDFFPYSYQHHLISKQYFQIHCFNMFF